MASPKDKLLESAQKAILKGQIDKAIKDYEQLVALEPKDLKHRQKLGELLARANRNSDAIRQFETIARSYENDSFYLKAIAVYKQIQKLDPANLNITLTLAALNEKQGLSGNALAEYKLVVDQYERTGKAKEAAGVLEKMLAIDKENLNVQLKLAETYVTASMKDEAYTQFTAALKTIKTRGDNATFERIATKVQALFPDRDLLFESLALDAQTGSPAEIIPRLRSFLAKQPAHKRGLTLLAELQKKSGDAAGRLATLRQLLQGHPGDMETTCGFIDGAIEAGEIAAAREALQHHFNILTKEPKVVEELFGKLRKAAPYDTSILQVMREFYDLTNDRAKLDEVENLLRLATPEVKSPATAQSAPEVDFSVSSGDMELDISGIGSADELFSTPATLSAVPSPPVSPTPAAVIPPPAPRATPPVTWEEDIEIDVDLDGYDSAQTMGNVERALDDEVEELDELADMDLMEPIELDLEPANDQGGYVTLGSLLDEDDEDGQIALSEDELLAEDEAVDIDELALPDINNLFDLGSDFSLPAEPASKRGGKYSSSGVLSAFRQSVDQQLDKQDTDTHYNLGIAYKEMGLFNDAVTEFTYASFDPGRKIDCMTLKGICYRESGDLEKAEELFRSALAYDSLSGEEHLSISYELALLLEADSRHGEAEAMYQQIIEADPSFQDASRRLARLQGNDTGQELLGSDGLDIELEEVE